MRRAAIVVTMLAFGGLAGASEQGSAPVVVTMQSRGRVRVQVSEGVTMPCDSFDDRMIFDGMLGPNESYRSSIASRCVCVRHTTDSFPRIEWRTSQLACRPVYCPNGHGHRCYPASDPTIRVSLDAR